MLETAARLASPGFTLALESAGVPHWIRRLEPALHYAYWEDVLWSVGAVVGALVLGRVTAQLLMLLARRWSRMTHTPIDDLALKHLADPLRWLVPLFAVGLVLPGIELSDTARETLHQLLVVSVILNVGWLLFRLVSVLEEVLRTRFLVDGTLKADASANYTQLQSFRNIAGFLIAVVSVGLALLSFGGVREIGTSVLASAGVVGVVVGFAAQRSIATVVAGLVIAIAQPIRIGDVVVVEGEGGTIEEITLTYVVVKLWDLRRLILPVNQFLEKPFENWSRSSTQLVGTVLLYLDYTLPVDAVRDELRRLLEASSGWDRGIWSVQVVDATEHTVVVRAQMSGVDTPTTWALRCEMREKLLTFIQTQHQTALPRRRNLAVS